jgi:hypothetical protein
MTRALDLARQFSTNSAEIARVVIVTASALALIVAGQALPL